MTWAHEINFIQISSRSFRKVPFKFSIRTTVYNGLQGNVEKCEIMKLFYAYSDLHETKNQMILWERIRNFLITFVIVNVHHYCVIVHENSVIEARFGHSLLIIYDLDTRIKFWTDQRKTFRGVLSDFQSKQRLSGQIIWKCRNR